MPTRVDLHAHEITVSLIVLTCCLSFDFTLGKIVQVEKRFETTHDLHIGMFISAVGYLTGMCGYPTFTGSPISAHRIALGLKCSIRTVKKVRQRYRYTATLPKSSGSPATLFLRGNSQHHLMDRILRLRTETFPL